MIRRSLGAGSAAAWPLAVDPLGRFVLVGVANLGLVKLPIRADGTLGAPVNYFSSNLVSIAVHPSGAAVYTLSSDGYLRTYSINTSTGALAPTGEEPVSILGQAPASLGIDGRGRILTLGYPTNGMQTVRVITDTATGMLGAGFVNPTSDVVADVFDPSREGVNYLLKTDILDRNVIATVPPGFSRTAQTVVLPKARAIGLLVR